MNRSTFKRLVFGELTLKRFVKSLLFIYVALAVFAYFFSDRLIFQPQPVSYRQNSDLLTLTTADGVKIVALHLPNPRATYTVLYSHGNGEDLGDIRASLQAIREAGFAVFAYDYRGYGLSQGTPSEAGAYQDINAAYTYLTTQLRVAPDRIILQGRSVGSGPSVDLATRLPVAGLILESPFTSTFVVLTRIPLFPFDKFNNLAKIRAVHCPVLIIHGTQDQTIPLSHAEALFRAAHDPKQALWVQGADHNDVAEIAADLYPNALRQFAQLLRQPTTPQAD